MTPAEDALAPDDLDLAIIVAVAENGVIGADDEIPWYYPEDLAHFKETTMGHPVICGRKTYESIVDRLGEPLPGRPMVVLTSRDLDVPEGAVAVGSVDAAVEIAADLASEMGTETVYVIGGSTVYEQFLDRADRLVWTDVHESPAGDTRFPPVDWEAWTEIERDDRDDLSFVAYERSSSTGRRR